MKSAYKAAIERMLRHIDDEKALALITVPVFQMN